MKSVHFDLNEGDNRVSSVSNIHQNAVSQLQELLDMHDNCSYLLELHQAINSFESSVNQLLYQCSRRSVVDKKKKWEDTVVKSPKDSEIDLESDDKCVEIDEETYRLVIILIHLMYFGISLEKISFGIQTITVFVLTEQITVFN